VSIIQVAIVAVYLMTLPKLSASFTLEEIPILVDIDLITPISFSSV
jgi:hypothetical protein